MQGPYRSPWWPPRQWIRDLARSRAEHATREPLCRTQQPVALSGVTATASPVGGVALQAPPPRDPEACRPWRLLSTDTWIGLSVGKKDQVRNRMRIAAERGTNANQRTRMPAPVASRPDAPLGEVLVTARNGASRGDGERLRLYRRGAHVGLRLAHGFLVVLVGIGLVGFAWDPRPLDLRAVVALVGVAAFLGFATLVFRTRRIYGSARGLEY